MSPEVFEHLTVEQQMSLLIAMHVRNELEDFHVEHLSNRDMPELNSTIRYAICDFFSRVHNDERFVARLAMMVPEYWEIPGKHPKPTFSGEYLFDGKPVKDAATDRPPSS